MSLCIICHKEIKSHPKHKVCKECKVKREKENEGTLHKPRLTG